MTAPLGSTLPTPRTPDGQSGAHSPVASPAPSESVPAAHARWSTPPQARPTADHLALVQALIQAGQFSRAMELLDAVWHHDLHDERCWYLRLWLLTAQGRVLEALELGRVAAGELPGSAAIAYLQSTIEATAGHPDAALEAALRSAAIAPGRLEPEALLERLLVEREARGQEVVRAERHSFVAEAPLNPVALALAGLALLHPSGSALVYRPVLLAGERPVASPRSDARSRRRLWLMAVATIGAALVALRDPLLAIVALAGAMAWLSRPVRASARR